MEATFRFFEIEGYLRLSPPQKERHRDCGGQTVNETNGFRQFDESFGQAFSKACAVEAAEASSPSAEGEISLMAFSFASFSFAPTICKRNATKEIVEINKP